MITNYNSYFPGEFMAVQDAQNFIIKISKDNKYRTSLYEFETFDKRMSHIKETGYDFEFPEFEEASTQMLRKCQTEENALVIKELLMWWKMVNGDVPDAIATAKPKCSPSDCSTCSGC